MTPPGLAPWTAFGDAVLALFQVVMIDLVLAGDNAVAVGMAAAGFERRRRRKVIWLGLAVAVAMRIGLAMIATLLLGLVGLLLAGGALLVWVAWRLWREMAARARAAARAPGQRALARPDSFHAAVLKILIADLSMSLDNVLGVAGAAHDRPLMLAFGLLLSIGFTGMGAAFIAEAMNRRPWIGYAGLAIIVYVACGMIWQGHRDLVIDLHKVAAYNRAMPGQTLDITRTEVARRRERKGMP